MLYLVYLGAMSLCFRVRSDTIMDARSVLINGPVSQNPVLLT